MEPVKNWLQRNLKGDPILWGIVLLSVLLAPVAVRAAAVGAVAAVYLLHGLEHQRGLALAYHSGYQPNFPALRLSQAGPDFSSGLHAQPPAAARAGFQNDPAARNAVGGPDLRYYHPE